MIRAAALMAFLCAASGAVSAQGGAAPAQNSPAQPTATTAPDIPGVVAGGTNVQVIAEGLRGTEGPIALPDGTLIFTEQNAAVITRIDANDRRSVYLENTGGSNGLTFDPKGRLIGTQPDKGAVAVLAPSYSVLAGTFEGKPFLRPNDVIADRRGGVYFTDPGPNPTPGQTLPGRPSVYYIRPDGSVMLVSAEITRPNGIILSPDERVLYVANTLGEAVVAFDVQPDGTVRNKRDFARLQGVTKTDTGVRSGADGLAVDSAGRLYVATQIGVQVFSPQGAHLGTIPIGIANGPQNLAFAGRDKKTLYVVGRGAAWKIPMLAEGPRERAK
jgi:gluconolactonase